VRVFKNTHTRARWRSSRKQCTPLIVY